MTCSIKTLNGRIDSGNDQATPDINLVDQYLQSLCNINGVQQALISIPVTATPSRLYARVCHAFL